MKMKKKKTFEDYIQTIAITLFAIGLVGWLIWSIYSAFYIPDKPNKTITFEVTGITNSANASTLVQVHFECIKYCNANTPNQYMSDCWAQCATLGKEGCSNGK